MWLRAPSNLCVIPWVNAHLVIQRKPLYYMANLVCPTAVISQIAVFGFFMPATTTGDRTEKVNLGITTLLAMSILLLMVSDTMPTTSNYIPLIGWFYLTIIVLVALSTFMTSLIIVVQKQGHFGQPVGRWMRVVFFHFMAKVLFMKPSQRLILRRQQAASEAAAARKIANGINQQNSVHRNSIVASNKNNGEDQSCNFASDELVNQLELIRGTLLKIEQFMTFNDRKTVSLLEWEYLSLILDRFLLILFTSAVVCCTLAMLLVGTLFKQDTVKQ